MGSPNILAPPIWESVSKYETRTCSFVFQLHVMAHDNRRLAKCRPGLLKHFFVFLFDNVVKTLCSDNLFQIL